MGVYVRECVAHASKTKPQINKQSNLHQLHLRQLPCLATICHWLPIAFFAMRFFCCILRSCGTWGIVLCPAWSACTAFNYAAIEKLRRVQQFFVPTLPGFPQGLPLLAVVAVVVAAATTKAMTTGFKFVTTTNSDRNNTSSSNSNNKLSRTIAKWSTNLITQFYWINSNLGGGGGAVREKQLPGDWQLHKNKFK